MFRLIDYMEVALLLILAVAAAEWNWSWEWIVGTRRKNREILDEEEE